jgi:hypothetical protein
MAQPDPLAPHLHAAVAQEMRHVRLHLEQLVEKLLSDDHFVREYLEQMQVFDLLIQCTEESAAVLDRIAQGATSHDAIAPVRLTAVQDRLRSALQRAA